MSRLVQAVGSNGLRLDFARSAFMVFQAVRARLQTFEEVKGCWASRPNTSPSLRPCPIRCSRRKSRRTAGMGTVRLPARLFGSYNKTWGSLAAVIVML
ncbi:MAG TPA: hypothetical protein VE644_11945, partial [Gaiellaceae bacterium]|nr:hypothetical protein [Gaiellaceae bacterium]